MSDQYLIEVRDVSRRFGEFYAVEDQSFTLQSGEVVGLLGPNGAGKTTTVKMLMGMLQPSEGSLSIGGKDCFQERSKVQEVVGYLPDEPFFQPYLRGYELLEFIAKIRNIAHPKIQQHIDKVGEKLGLVEDLGDFASNYSQGMRKKMAYLMATIHQPDVLIMDEPTNGLDPRANRAFLEDLRLRSEAGAGVLYSTHLLDQAEKVCARCLIMNQGQIVAEGSVSELKKLAGGADTLEEVFFSLTKETPEKKPILS